MTNADPFYPYISLPQSGQVLRYDGTKWTNIAGPILQPNGSASAPAYSFINEPDTGLYIVSSQLRIGVGGVEALRMSESGGSVSVSSLGNLGVVGRVTPTNGVAVTSGSVGGPSFLFATDTDTGMYSPGADIIALTAGGVEAIRFTESGGVVTPSGSGIWTPVKKTADETRNSNATLATDATLNFAMAANTSYIVRGWIPYTTDTSAGFQYDFTGPAGATATIGSIYLSNTTSKVEGADVGLATATSVVGTASGWVRFEAIVHNGANAGNFSFRWAQNTLDANDTAVLDGAYLEYQKQ